MSRTLWKSLPAGPDTFHRHCGVSVRASAAVLTSKLKGHSAGEMKMGKQTTDVTKAAALYMLKNGLASYKEIAELSGRSRQIHSYLGRES